MQKLKSLFRYLLYLIRSVNAHGVHSPFVFDLLTNVIYVDRNYYAFLNINRLRKRLIENDSKITIVDFGAGSHVFNASSKKISRIVRSSAKPKKYGELLFRLVNNFRPKTILELGTSLGMSAAYMGSACKGAKLISIEASEELANLAKENLKLMQLKNSKVVCGTFEEKLEEAILDLGKLDFVFFDGNHRKKPTLAYFETCLKHCSNKSVFIFDDINWSDEMLEAWEEIKNNPKVTVSIDLFFIGIIFFRKGQAKEHFTIRY